jgi:uncharacterized lipoprotein YajG
MKKIALALLAVIAIFTACQGQNPPADEVTPTPSPTVTETTFNATVPAVVPADGGTSNTFSKYN